MEKNFSISCFLLTASAIIMAATIPASCDSSGLESVPKPPEQPENMTTYGYGNLAAEALTPSTDRDWMKLFISIKGSESPDWEGFQWKVENYNPDSGKASLSSCEGGWEWTASEDVAFAISENRMEIAIPLAALGIKDARNFTVDFKWIDNSVPDGDICECMSDGDSAPDSRFRYRYIFKY